MHFCHLILLYFQKGKNTLSKQQIKYAPFIERVPELIREFRKCKF